MHNKPQINKVGDPKLQEREIIFRYAAGEFSNAVLSPDHERKGWTLSLTMNSGEVVKLETKRGVEIRLFKTSDAALRCCQRIGFVEVTVCF